MRAIISGLVLFPTSFLIIQFVALLLWRARPRLARVLLISMTVLIALLSVPNVVSHLAGLIEGSGSDIRLTDPGLALRAEAIVVLAAARVTGAKDYHGSVVSPTELTRLQYAVDLSKATRLPILITGGAQGRTQPSEAALMAEALEHYFGMHARWVEEKSINTAENASFSHKLLEAESIRRIFLVTHAMHMARTRHSFEKAGFTVVSAPMGYATDQGSEGSGEGWAPSAEGWLVTSQFFHEVYGLLWYRLRGY